jgi:hypothetical protein
MIFLRGISEILNNKFHVVYRQGERYGLLEVPRSKNGYRVYGEHEIKLLRVIKTLRQETIAHSA